MPESGEAAPRPLLPALQFLDAATEALSRDRLSYSSDETTVDGSGVSPPPPPPSPYSRPQRFPRPARPPPRRMEQSSVHSFLLTLVVVVVSVVTWVPL